MLKLPMQDLKDSVMTGLVKQSIKANGEQFSKARKEYHYWNEKVKECDRGSRDYLKYTIFADQYFYEYVTIKGTLIRLFPDHEDLIIEALYKKLAS
tara:strand:- start:141 stop:428 length:288 start_codon:yes stop_codon:yes gene_type:complete